MLLPSAWQFIVQWAVFLIAGPIFAYAVFSMWREWLRRRKGLLSGYAALSNGELMFAAAYFSAMAMILIASSIGNAASAVALRCASDDVADLRISRLTDEHHDPIGVPRAMTDPKSSPWDSSA